MVGRIDAAPPEALASPDASRRFVGAITDETLPSALQRKNCRWHPYTMATRAMGVHPYRARRHRSLGAS
jgi:hypothetical protein